MFRGHRSTSFLPALLRAAGWWIALGLGSTAAFGTELAKEYQIKAAFLYNFTRFVEWPPGRLGPPDTPLTIGVLGDNPFGHELENATRGRQVNGHPIRVVALASAAESRSVHVLFVAADAERLLSGEPEPGVLTVGETERFAALGGMITFITEGDRVRFMINLQTATAADLRLSSQLLKLASTVRRKS